MTTTLPQEARPVYEQTAVLRGHSRPVVSVAFSPNGQSLASGSKDKTVRVWEVESGALISTLKGHSAYVSSLAFHPGDHRLASASSDKTLRIWETSTGLSTATLEGHTDEVLGAAFSPDGALLASASFDQTVRLWDATSGELVKVLQPSKPGGAYCVAFSPDGTLLASGVYSGVHFWNPESGVEVGVTTGGQHTSTIFSIAFSPDGTLLSSGSNDKTVKLWRVPSGENIATFKEHLEDVQSVAFAPSGKILVSGSRDGKIYFWDVTSRSRVATLTDGVGVVKSLAFSPDGSYLASALLDETIRLWKSGESLASRPKAPQLSIVFNATQNTGGYSIGSVSPTESLLEVETENDISHLVTLTADDRVGSGGFGDLYLGVHKELGKVAMKRPHSILTETLLRRFLREINLWCTMSHRYILPCLGTCKIGRELYVVSPYISNGDLMACIRRQMALNRRKLLYEVAEALAHLHHLGIVHGDIKALNVLISNDGSALLCDFGLAKTLDNMVTSTDVKGAGSVRWMAPELLIGESGRSTESDVYSFGIIIAEVLSGRTPYEHIQSNATVAMHVLLKNGRPSKEPSSDPEGRSYSLLWETAEWCWATEVNDRPSMAQVLGCRFH